MLKRSVGQLPRYVLKSYIKYKLPRDSDASFWREEVTSFMCLHRRGSEFELCAMQV